MTVTSAAIGSDDSDDDWVKMFWNTETVPLGCTKACQASEGFGRQLEDVRRLFFNLGVDSKTRKREHSSEFVGAGGAEHQGLAS